MRKFYYYLHIIDKKIEAQKNLVTPPRLYIYHVGTLGLELGLTGLEPIFNISLIMLCLGTVLMSV